VLVYSAIAGGFGGFFGSPIIGAIGAFEYMYIKELDFHRHLIPGLVAAAVGYGVYFAFLHSSYLGIYSFPNFASPRLVDLGWALLVGVIAGVIGIMFKVIFGIMHLVFGRLNKRAIVGGVVIGLIVKTERKAISVTYVQEPTVLFTIKNLEQQHSTCSNPSDRKTIFLVIKNEGTDQSPRQITNHEDFRNRPFNELWEWAITPKFSLDRGVKDQLQDRQYG
jgi:hypothetical protein